VSYLSYEAYRAVFPALPSGVYAGTLTVKDQSPQPFLVDSMRGPRDLAAAVGDPAIPAQRVQTLDISGSTGLPLVLTGERARLRFVGKEHEPGRYEGSFIDPIRNLSGRWRLERVSVPELAPDTREWLQTWGAIYQELVAVEGEIGSVMRGEEKAQPSGPPGGDVVAQQAALDQAVRNLELSARLTAAGKLAHLSRESIEREGRWIRQVLSQGSPEMRPSFEQELERAYRVKALLDQISEERRLLDTRPEEEPLSNGGEAASDLPVREEGAAEEGASEGIGEGGFREEPGREGEEAFYGDL